MGGAIRCVIMRGGTSKAVVFSESDLPLDPAERDLAILAAFGSPDPRQIDGLGGADPLTSKVAIVGRSMRRDADLDYTFGQVGIRSPSINYAVSCGNTAAAVAIYAIHEKLVHVAAGQTSMRIHCTNNGKTIVATVPTPKGVLRDATDFGASGVLRPGAQVGLEFLEPAGGDTGQLLPSGSVVEELRTVRGRRVRFSLVDCGNLYAIIPAETWSLRGNESPVELELVPALRQEIEEVREAVAARFLRDDGRTMPLGRRGARLKVAIVGPADGQTNPLEDGAQPDSVDLVARIVNTERVHQAFAVTGAMCLSAAAVIPGTVVGDLMNRRPAPGCDVIRIGHPQGVISPEIAYKSGSGGPLIESIKVDRTARRIMDGLVYLPAEEGELQQELATVEVAG